MNPNLPFHWSKISVQMVHWRVLPQKTVLWQFVLWWYQIQSDHFKARSQYYLFLRKNSLASVFAFMDDLLPWSKSLPDCCRRSRVSSYSPAIGRGDSFHWGMGGCAGTTSNYAGKIPALFDIVTCAIKSHIIIFFISFHVMLGAESCSFLHRIMHFFKTSLVIFSSSHNSKFVILPLLPSCSDSERNL